MQVHSWLPLKETMAFAFVTAGEELAMVYDGVKSLHLAAVPSTPDVLLRIWTLIGTPWHSPPRTPRHCCRWSKTLQQAFIALARPRPQKRCQKVTDSRSGH